MAVLAIFNPGDIYLNIFHIELQMYIKMLLQ